MTVILHVTVFTPSVLGPLAIWECCAVWELLSDSGSSIHQRGVAEQRLSENRAVTWRRLVQTNSLAITIRAFELSHFQQSESAEKQITHSRQMSKEFGGVFTTTMATGVAIATPKLASRPIS
jgi:hypothetical protein